MENLYGLIHMLRDTYINIGTFKRILGEMIMTLKNIIELNQREIAVVSGGRTIIAGLVSGVMYGFFAIVAREFFGEISGTDCKISNNVLIRKTATTAMNIGVSLIGFTFGCFTYEANEDRDELARSLLKL